MFTAQEMAPVPVIDYTPRFDLLRLGGRGKPRLVNAFIDLKDAISQTLPKLLPRRGVTADYDMVIVEKATGELYQFTLVDGDIKIRCPDSSIIDANTFPEHQQQSVA